MSKHKFFTVSNLLSLARLMLVIPVWFFIDNFPDQNFRYLVIAAGIFAVITDVLDGYLARRLNEITEFGKIIDPLADKILIGFVILRLFLLGEIPAYYFFMIVGRDLFILIGGLLIAYKTKYVLPSDYLGKATVIAISIVMLMIILNLDGNSIYFNLFYYLSIGLIIVSFSNYTYKAIQTITKK
jgi:CDP-diacylglycerol--glycerol-3-phosphate 3-phosphatidyltransferase